MSAQSEEMEKHAADQEHMKLLVNILRDMPVERYIERMRRAISYGAVADPTLYIKKSADLAVELEIAEIIAEAKIALNKVAQRELPNIAKLKEADAV